LVTSIQLADIVGDAVGISRESAQLHLKIIRAAGHISFKGYGRSAADMTSLDAARLLIASTASTFAKDSTEMLERFAHLKPLGRKSINLTLESALEKRLDELPMHIPSEDDVKDRVQSRRPFGSRRLAEDALQLYEPIGAKTDELPRYAVLRWLTAAGHSNVLRFGPGDHRDALKGEPNEQVTDTIRDILQRYSDHRLFQVRVLERTALIDVSAALKGVSPSYGNAYGNTR
jgi:hypothetical protein